MHKKPRRATRSGWELDSDHPRGQYAGRIMNAERMEALLALEREVNAELEKRAEAERAQCLHKNWPISDGVVDEALYLTTTPKMLWILKEPWEVDEGEGAGDWSLTKDAIPRMLKEGSIGDKRIFANMAWVTYSVLNGFQTWQQMPCVSNEPKVGESLRRIAYINVSKLPGQKVTRMPKLRACYERNKAMLLRQVETIAPDVIIGGYTLHFFFNDFGLTRADFTQGSERVSVCHKNGRLHVDAYHPACRFGSEKYVDGIVTAIKPFRQHWEPAISA